MNLPSNILLNKDKVNLGFISSEVLFNLHQEGLISLDGWYGYTIISVNSFLRERLTDVNQISSVPQFFQEEITKKIELRVVATEDKIFTYAVDSQSREETQVDWRIGSFSLKFEREKSFDHILHPKIIQYLKSLDLIYGVFDFIVTHDDELVFLECNNDGQWYWIEEEMKDGMPQAIASAINKKYFS